MLMTEEEKKRLAELERRKRKIIEEEQNRLNDFNADQQRLLIFSHIFRISPQRERLPKRARQKLKRQAVRFGQEIAPENKATQACNEQAEKNKHQNSSAHLPLFHNDKSRYRQTRVPDELLHAYVTNLKKRT